MYDTRVARRWNLDPVYKATISNYSTFANNPIFFSDPLGDTVRVKDVPMKGQENITASYIDGAWRDNDYNVIDMDDVKNNNLKKDLMHAYEEINGISDLNLLTNVLNNSKHTIFIDLDDEELVFDSGYFFSQLKDNPNANLTLRMGKAALKYPSERNFQNRDHRNSLAGVLTHELGHVYDALVAGNTNFKSSLPGTNPKMDKVTRSELNAMYFENIYRYNKGWGLRTYYEKSLYPNAKAYLPENKEKKTFLIRAAQYPGSKELFPDMEFDMK